MPDLPPDAELLRRYLSDDDADAFGLLVRRHRGLVYGTCARVLRPGAAAEDAAQEAFVRLMSHAGTITGSLPAWLHRVAVNLCRDHQRSEAARRTRERAPRPGADDRPEPADLAAERHELEDRVDAALLRLPDAERVLLTEHFLREVPQTVIAEREGVSRATLSRRVGRALVLLRERLEDATPQPQRKRAVTAAATLAVLMLAGGAHAAAVPAALAGSLNRLTMLSGSTASGVVDAPAPTASPAPPAPPAGALSSAGRIGPSPLAFTLVFLLPLAAMALCAALAAGVVWSGGVPAASSPRAASAERLPATRAADGDAEGDADAGDPGRVVEVPGAQPLRSDQATRFLLDGDAVQLVYGDGHAVTLDRAEADRRLRAQTGRSLDDLAQPAP